MSEKILEQLKGMKEKYFMYKTDTHKILNYRIIGDDVEIVTDRGFIMIVVSEALNTLKNSFLPASEVSQGVIVYNQSDYNLLAKMKNIVEKNIENLQEDKGYISQAEAVNKSISTLINITKLEIQMAQFGKKLKG